MVHVCSTATAQYWQSRAQLRAVVVQYACVTVSRGCHGTAMRRRGSRWEQPEPAVIGRSASAAARERGQTTQEVNTGRRCSLTTLQDLPARLRFMDRYLRPLSTRRLFCFSSISPKRAATKTDKLCSSGPFFLPPRSPMENKEGSQRL